MSHVLIYTARIAYPGPHRYDCTRKGDSPFGPSWTLLAPYKEKARAGTLTLADWTAYEHAYKREMRALWVRNRAVWTDLAAFASREKHVVLCCYCTDPERCHRTVLAGLLLLALPALDVPCSLGEPTELLQSEGWW